MVVVRRIETAAGLAEAHRLRIQVFVDEQRFAMSDEIDALDAISTHWLLLPDTAATTPESDLSTLALGNIRLVPATLPGTASPVVDASSTTATLGRLCLTPAARGHGYAKLLIQALHDEARSRGLKSLTLFAQTDKVGLYRRFGYVDDAPAPVMYDGAPHMIMRLTF
ncbi:acyl-CoA N-acyltransferase [Entophlyctis helioformis]|nr:acyl-CoA N-acyltransferase [Entophlyctis helioformis]